MAFYKLSEGRVRTVLNSPKRVEEGIAPKTVAMMQPVSVTYHRPAETVPSGAKRSRGALFQHGKFGGKSEENWKQEIWVMIQDEKSRRKVISAWRYPGKSKPKDEIFKDRIKKAYTDYLASAK